MWFSALNFSRILVDRKKNIRPAHSTRLRLSNIKKPWHNICKHFFQVYGSSEISWPRVMLKQYTSHGLENQAIRGRKRFIKLRRPWIDILYKNALHNAPCIQEIIIEMHVWTKVNTLYRSSQILILIETNIFLNHSQMSFENPTITLFYICGQHNENCIHTDHI